MEGGEGKWREERRGRCREESRGGGGVEGGEEREVEGGEEKEVEGGEERVEVEGLTRKLRGCKSVTTSEKSKSHVDSVTHISPSIFIQNHFISFYIYTKPLSRLNSPLIC